MNKLLILLLVLVVLTTINILIIDKIDQKMFYHMIFKDKVIYQAYLSKYIPHILFRLLISLVYILILPINILYTIYETGRYNTNFLTRFLIKLKHPFLFPHTEGAMYPLISYLPDDLFINLNSKLFWYKFFKKHGVKTPEVYGIVKDGKLYTNKTSKLDNSETYIIKPDDAIKGIGVYKYTHNKTDLPKTGTHLIQQKVETCKSEVPESLRIITTSKNGKIDIFLLRYLKQTDPNKVTSNVSSGGGYKRIDKQYFVSVTDGKLEKIPDDMYKKFQETTKLAKYLHTKLPQVITIGWDIILSCDGPYFLEGNVGTGMILPNDKSFYQIMPKYVHWLKN